MRKEHGERKENEPTVDLNVVILPDERTTGVLLDWSERIASRFPTAYVLDRTNTLPHLSIYSAQYPARNQMGIEGAVGRIAQDRKPFDVQLSGFSAFSGFVFYDAVKDAAMNNIHESLVEGLNPLREGHISKTQRQLTNLSEAQKEAIEDYGYVGVKELYKPHISVTKMLDPQQTDEAIALLPRQDLIFSVRQIAIAPVADYGTCLEPTNKFIL